MSHERLQVEICGAVQGVGFRPFVYRLASDLDLRGTVRNDSRGVFIDMEGPREALEQLLESLQRDCPPLSIVHSLRTVWAEPVGHKSLRIVHSDAGGDKTVVVLPDAATCAECLAEVADPLDRRHGYVFTNCTNCGPRFSIIERLPYDRPNTTMRRFVMCPACQQEYDDPHDRRFHAQPNACPDCGPQLVLLDATGDELGAGDAALAMAADRLRDGAILALKGLGGFLLMADARDEDVVQELRRRKDRPDKPLAIMAADLEQARALCEIPPEATELLRSPQAPILLLRRGADSLAAAGVAPGNPWLGVMLPYTPLHHRLLAAVGFPLVATSGNLTDEPICIDNDEALQRLGTIADLFLIHDRPIQRHVDDSVVRLHEGMPQPLRRARGLAPLPVILASAAPSILALGAHLKNTVALSVGADAFVSQHIGDMETPQALDAFQRVVFDFLDLYEAAPVAIAHDLHPDYATTRWAQAAASGTLASASSAIEVPVALAGTPLIPVQHHHAHLAACLAENHVAARALGVTWDGTGYGTDGTIWGGEFLLGDVARFDRVASLRPFRLPGGDAAIRQPARIAAAMLWELFGDSTFTRQDLPPIAHLESHEHRVIRQMLRRGFRSPVTTSAGRLFDGVAALVGLNQRVSFEGQAAMALEFAADRNVTEAYAMPIESSGDDSASHLNLDWRVTLERIVEDVGRGVGVETIAAKFHNALAHAVLDIAQTVAEPRVALTGGCFQNELLAWRTAQLLRGAGFEVLQHRHVPPNDGGISLGQIAVASSRLR